MMEREPVPWFVRILFPDVVVPVLIMAAVVAMAALAIWRQIQ